MGSGGPPPLSSACAQPAPLPSSTFVSKHRFPLALVIPVATEPSGSLRISQAPRAGSSASAETMGVSTRSMYDCSLLQFARPELSALASAMRPYAPRLLGSTAAFHRQSTTRRLSSCAHRRYRRMSAISVPLESLEAT